MLTFLAGIATGVVLTLLGAAIWVVAVAAREADMVEKWDI